MTHRVRYVQPLKHTEYHLLKIKITHRNMRKLADLYKQYKWRQVYGWYKNTKMRFRYSTRYRKHPNSAGWWVPSSHMKDSKYIYVMSWTYTYTNQRRPHARTLLIKRIDKENIRLIKYAVCRFFRGSPEVNFPF